jgi:hypothetical protein
VFHIRGFSTIAIIYGNYYYQHPNVDIILWLKVSKEEEAYLTASQYRSKTGAKPEVRSPSAH